MGTHWCVKATAQEWTSQDSDSHVKFPIKCQTDTHGNPFVKITSVSHEVLVQGFEFYKSNFPENKTSSIVFLKKMKAI